MKKNALLTFLFACIPGAGQMYYGYMQRGLSLITMFCGCFFLGWLAQPLVVTMGIVWMYSFFDTYDLIRYMAAGDPKPDGLLLFGDLGDLKRFVPKHNKLLGWGLILLGVWALYDNVLDPIVYSLLVSLLGDGSAWRIRNMVPSLVVAAVLILCGLRLLGVRPRQKPEDLPPYPHGDDRG